MSDHAAARAKIDAALNAEPKPITRERALAVARSAMAGVDAALIGPFSEWFAKHGDRLVERLNG